MFADAENVEPDAIGKFDLLHQIGEGLVGGDRLAGQRIAPGLDESVDAKLHRGLGTHDFRRAGMMIA